MTTALPEPDDRPDSRPPQFGLRTLFLVMTLLSVLFAVMTAVGAIWSVAIVFFLCLVVGHVTGNALGTRLRDESTRQSAAPREPDASRAPAARNEAPSHAPAKRLVERTRASRAMKVTALLGALLGGLFGGYHLATQVLPQANLAGVVVGTISAAVLGGFFGFLLSSFISVLAGTLRDAHRKSWADRSPPA